MTSITILEQKLIQLQEKRNAAGLICRELEDARIDRLSAMFNKVFAGTLEADDVLEVSSNRVQFTRQEPGRNYHKDILDLYFRSAEWRTELATTIETSFYSTKDNSEFELRRMILIGKVGQIVLDQSQDILQQFNAIISDTQAEIREAYEVANTVIRDIADITKQIANLHAAALLDRLHDTGIEFNMPSNDAYRLPTLDITATRQIRRVKDIRVLATTASGKSADIQVTTIDSSWDAVAGQTVDRETERAVYKVRMSMIESFIRDNADRVIPAA
jgi:hypothetical protein